MKNEPLSKSPLCRTPNQSDERFRKYALLSLILLLGLILFVELTPYLSGILGAITLYIIVRRSQYLLTDKHGFRPGISALLLLLAIVLLFLIPLGLLVWLLVDRLANLHVDPQQIIVPAEHLIAFLKEKTGYNLLNAENLKEVAGWVPRVSQLIAGWAGGLGVNVFVMLVVLYFMLVGSRPMEQYIYQLLPFTGNDKRNVLRQIKRIVSSNALGIPLLALVQGAVATLGYYLFQLPNPLLLGVLTAVASVIPIVGTALVWIPMLAYLLVIQAWWQAMGLLGYALLVIVQVDNLTRFLLQKWLADIHPLITIFGVVIGLSLFGFMGIIFGPLLISLFLLFVNIFKTEYLDKRRETSIEGLMNQAETTTDA